ncbi:MAG: aminopeptidase P family protein [Lentisphaerae bacterium]|jgi:Xaa-Pro aminopeptidase|nr:aminopeptidase P family protein [Lentisphaerota bacterium]
MKKPIIPRVLLAAGMEKTDVFYATGLDTPDPFVLVKAGARLHLVVSALEASRAKRVCPKAILHTPGELFAGEPGGARRSYADQIRAVLERLGATGITVGSWFPHGVAEALRAGGIVVSLDPAPPFPGRAIKTPREIAFIAKTQRAAVAAMRRAIAVLREAEIRSDGRLQWNGRLLTSERVKAEIERTLLARGCSAEGPIVASGSQGARPHDTGSGPLRAHSPIVIDIFPRDQRTGYWGDLTRTVVRGRATPEVRRMYRAVRAAQALALSMVRPGVESRAVQHAVEQFFTDEGYPTRLSPPGRESGFIHSVGHGIGLDIHENPGLRNEPGRLRAGNVVTVEPGLYQPGLGGVRIEDTVVVTPDGCRILASLARTLEI